MSDKTKVPCLICAKALKNFAPRGNQPGSGTEFLTHGHYGSGVTDRMDGTGFAVNICDDCLVAAKSQKRVLIVDPPKPQPRRRETYRVWKS